MREMRACSFRSRFFFFRWSGRKGSRSCGNTSWQCHSLKSVNHAIPLLWVIDGYLRLFHKLFCIALMPKKLLFNEPFLIAAIVLRKE